MGRTSGAARTLLAWLALVSLLSACQSVPVTEGSLPSQSSLLAVDVAFPAALSRDPSLVQVFFVKGPVHAGLDELPELVPASFVKWSRAYLLDPEPGTYSVVAATAAYAPPWNDHPIAGVSDTTWSGTSSDAMIFPGELIEQTITTVAPGRVAFMGALRVGRGERINAKTHFQDYLQKRLAERIRPGVTSESGLAGWLKRARLVDLEETSLGNEPADRAAFFDAALTDLAGSPWAGVIARAAPPEVTAARPGAGTSASGRREAARTGDPARRTAPAPEAAVAEPLSAVREPEASTGEPLSSPIPEPEARVARPEPLRFPAGIPPDSPLSEIAFGMSHHQVRKILGDPDDRIDRLTAKAWIPFYNGPGANLRDWVYAGRGRVVFSLYHGKLAVIDVVYDPDAGK